MCTLHHHHTNNKKTHVRGDGPTKRQYTVHDIIKRSGRIIAREDKERERKKKKNETNERAPDTRRSMARVLRVEKK
jgi:hypothetical protein